MKFRTVAIVAAFAVLFIVLAATLGLLFLQNQIAPHSTSLTMSSSTTSSPTLPETSSSSTASSTTTSNTCSGTVTSGSTDFRFVPQFNFNESSALRFYSDSNSSTGLLREYPGSNTVFLSDTQGLDYIALQNIYRNTNNSIARSLSENITRGMLLYGGIWNASLWNPAYEVIGNFGPYGNQIVNGTDRTLPENADLTLIYTDFSPNPNFYYLNFSDLTSYRVLLDLHFGNYCSARADFSALSNMWDGHGFNDSAFNESLGVYQSFKLADYLIAWVALLTIPQTYAFGLNYIPTAQSVASTMSLLQNNATGGVWTGYVYDNEQIGTSLSISGMNGETTSLFDIAWNLWPNHG